jgi:hypothetical protein
MKKMIAVLALLGLSSPLFAQEAPAYTDGSNEVATTDSASAAASGTLNTAASIGLGVAAAAVIYSVAADSSSDDAGNDNGGGTTNPPGGTTGSTGTTGTR